MVEAGGATPFAVSFVVLEKCRRPAKGACRQGCWGEQLLKLMRASNASRRKLDGDSPRIGNFVNETGTNCFKSATYVAIR
jgi:hypothetical protein